MTLVSIERRLRPTWIDSPHPFMKFSVSAPNCDQEKLFKKSHVKARWNHYGASWKSAIPSASTCTAAAPHKLKSICCHNNKLKLRILQIQEIGNHSLRFKSLTGQVWLEIFSICFELGFFHGSLPRCYTKFLSIDVSKSLTRAAHFL